MSGVCNGHHCWPPACDDYVQNGYETDVDCGGSICRKCGTGEKCLQNTDCLYGNCSSNVCAAPPTSTCTDGLMNGNETGVDCGGIDCSKCSNGLTCKTNTDCMSGKCIGGVCVAI